MGKPPAQQRDKHSKGAKKTGKKSAARDSKSATPGGRVVKPNGKGTIKKRMRDVDRLLSKPDLAPDLRAAQEAKRAALQAALEENKRSVLERKMAVKYHKVRFFERVKVERRQTQLARLVSEAKAKQQQVADEVLTEIEQNTRDVLYVKNFPRGEKYVSLLKKGETPEAQAHLDAQRARLRAIVEKAAAEAALLGEADEGRSLSKKEAKRLETRELHAADEQDIHVTEGEGEEDVGEDDFFLEDGGGAAAAAPATTDTKQQPEKRAGRAAAEKPAKRQRASGGGDSSSAPSSSDEGGGGSGGGASSSEDGGGSGDGDEGSSSSDGDGEDATAGPPSPPPPTKPTPTPKSAGNKARGGGSVQWQSGGSSRPGAETEQERKTRWKKERELQAQTAKEVKVAKRHEAKAVAPKRKREEGGRKRKK